MFIISHKYLFKQGGLIMFYDLADKFVGNSCIKIISDKIGDNKNARITLYVLSVLLGSLLITLSAKIKVPLYPIPMTLQPLMVLLLAMIYGKNLATATVTIYILKGIIGFPVFAFGGGLLYIFGPTGGFIFGFLIASFVVGHLADKGWGQNILKSLLCMFIGLFLIYFFGLSYFAYILNFEIMFQKAVYPFILKDSYTLLFLGLFLPQFWKFLNR